MSSTSFNTSSGTNQSTGQSTSSSTPSVMTSANSAESLAISEAAAALGAQQYAWANSQYAKTSQVTDQAVGNYLTASTADMNLAQGAISDYNNVYRPEQQQLANLAGSYSSNARVAMNVGAAESTQAQASDAALANTKQNLQSYGIDPSSGTYAQLEQATNAARGASSAGAGQQAQQATTATGRQLLGQSVAVGQQLPGQAVNATNAANTGYAGAVNAELANANTGANMFNSANNFYNTASQIKLAPVGNTSTSQSTNQSTGKTASTGTSTTTPNQSSGSSGGGSTAPTSVTNPYDVGWGANNNAQPDTSPVTGGSTSQTGGYARGGAIPVPHPAATRPLPDATSGGHVPYEISPSHGHQVDDVHANLNAGEFVIPRDVTGYMGQKFFQDVIMKARKANAMAPAHGSGVSSSGGSGGRESENKPFNMGGAI